MDTKFSSAIHTLILISESETPINSDQLAQSVGTNASYIRKLTTRLRKAGIIEGRRGISGFRLLRKPDEISLFDVYKAVMETNTLHLFIKIRMMHVLLDIIFVLFLVTCFVKQKKM